MADPIGDVIELREQPSGIRVGRMRVPIGVFAMIYESRPNVTIEAASLAIKSGNACILRGGSEALASNVALGRIVQAALAEAGLPPDAVQLVETRDRAAVGHLIARAGIDRPRHPARRQGPDRADRARGEGAGAQAPRRQLPRLRRRRRRPGDGAGDRRQRQDAEGQPVQRRRVAARPRRGRGDVPADDRRRVRARRASRCAATRRRCAALAGVAGAKLVAASEADWSEEYLAPIISIKVVDGFDAALAHIDRYGSHHTDAIVTDSHANAMRFLREVDSASVMVNASTRFADGFEYGLGAEIGISTDKLHARGPVGLEGLTSLKWIVLGQGELRG